VLRRSLLTGVLLAASTTAFADTVWIGGASLADDTAVGYTGVTFPLFGHDALSDGWQQSVVIDYVRFDYDLSGQTITGRAAGLKYTLGHEFSMASGFLRVSLGGRATNTDLSPDDPANRSRGAQTRGLAELQWRSSEASAWRSRGFAEYVAGARRSNVAAFVGRKLQNGLVLGPQVTSSGDPSYRVHGLAIALGGWKIGAAEASVHAGAQHREGGDTGPEVGFDLTFYRTR